ncbi:hypothetical protein BU23DRAFT_596726 [Bimuria novae-zelandiae CBS 107.79]|uniref:Uncharacterized protein n=1 Tax=Bimuria novae-zelandiae CBS 107.79 TaxID=1447943 RepID=A0A6A5VHR7_9PLEO|nr:hypothetical protein BU23DRAFT_596726 [Bimuria novae-zelandiae CBS 107.79]
MCRVMRGEYLKVLRRDGAILLPYADLEFWFATRRTPIRKVRIQVSREDGRRCTRMNILPLLHRHAHMAPSSPIWIFEYVRGEPDIEDCWGLDDSRASTTSQEFTADKVDQMNEILALKDDAWLGFLRDDKSKLRAVWLHWKGDRLRLEFDAELSCGGSTVVSRMMTPTLVAVSSWDYSISRCGLASRQGHSATSGLTHGLTREERFKVWDLQ